MVLLSTGLRREEPVTLDLGQVEPSDPEKLRTARRIRVRGVKGKGETERNVFLSRDAREAVAEYLETERPKDAGPESEALLLSAAGTPARREDGRLSVRAVNLLLERIGRCLGVRPAACVTVGDNMLADVSGAIGVGMRTVWKRNDGPWPKPQGGEPSATVERLEELPELLRSWGAS